MADDPYVYPGTNVLKNLPEIRDEDQLRRFESLATFKRIAELEYEALRGSFDVKHVRRIHHHVFQDVYSWAGEFRNVDIGKEGHWFCRPECILETLTDLFKRLAKEDYLRQTKLEVFLSRASHYLGELNAIHPFREGNGRVQREFIRELGIQAGFQIDWSTITRDQMYSASETSFRAGDNRAFVRILRGITTPLGPQQTK